MKKEFDEMFLDSDLRDLDVIGIKPSGVQYEYNSHPLLNAESQHYEMVGGMEAIEMMESMFTIEELKAWAKLTAMKYRLRIGKKDDPTKEIKKIKTFEDYYRYLDNLPTSVNSLS